MEQILNELKNLSAELALSTKQIAEVKKQLAEYENARIFDNWIPRKKLMEFFDYGETQIAAIFKNGNLTVTEIGKRKFVKRESVIKLLENNVKCSLNKKGKTRTED